MTVTLPWPDKALSANARLHWAPKSRATKRARQDAAWLTRAAGSVTLPDGPIAVRVTFHPPTKRRHDRDNLIGRMKAAQDGIADALGVDDARFEPTYAMGEVRRGGAVVVEIGA